MIVVQGNRNCLIFRLRHKCNTCTIFLDVFTQWFQSKAIRIHLVAVLSAVCCIVCIYIQIQSLWHWIITRCFGCIQRQRVFCKAFCTNHPAYLPNGFSQIDLRKLLFQLFIGIVKMQGAFI